MKLPLAVRRSRLFKFLASLNLALWLLAVVIVALIAGTLYESSFSAEVAKAYVYGAWWFQIWLALLVLNLASVAFSRMPWKRRHLPFLLTHFGIITILLGAMVGKWFGIEGSVTLFEEEPGTSRLVINQHQLTISQTDGSAERSFPVRVIKRSPSEKRSWKLGNYRDLRIELIGYSDRLKQKFQVAEVETDGQPAIKVRLHTAIMNQTIEKWLWLGDQKHSKLDMQLAEVSLGGHAIDGTGKKAGAAKEYIFVYELKPGDQVSRVEFGIASGLKIRFDRKDGLLTFDIRRGEKRWQYQCRADELPKSWKLEGTELMLQFADYWSDFSVKDGVPVSLSDEPNNPAALIEVHSSSDGSDQINEAPEVSETDVKNRLHYYLDSDGIWRYQLSSRKQGEQAGTVEVGTELVTGWADWTVTVQEILPYARADYHFEVLEETEVGVKGVKVRLSRGENQVESWLPVGWQIDLRIGREQVRVLYGLHSEALPFVIRLENFELERNPGSLDPAAFTSHLEIIEPGGGSTKGFCTMNEPMNYPDAWWRSLTGLTYKMSQAGWNPENLNQSSIQILRDPGWLFKWTGSLVFCLGVFYLFYGKPVKKTNRSVQKP